MEATDEDVYNQAIGEQTENTPETPVEAPTEAKAERVRDEKGRFVSATPEPASEEVSAEEPVSAPVEAPSPVEKEDARVPSWRLAEESQRRREAEQALNDLRNEMRQYTQMLQMQQMQPPQSQEELDIFADPQGFVRKMQDDFSRQMQTLRLENSLERADARHGETFRKAYDAFTDHVSRTRDQATYQRVMASSDPGSALVQWFKSEELNKQLGDSDLTSFIEKQKEEWLKDPAVQAKVIEAFKATQAPPANKITNLPPSLSKAPAQQSAHDGLPKSQADIYKYATGR